jgi:signal transduction histidine kinase
VRSWTLGSRLLAAFLVVVVAALGTVAIAVLLIGPAYFADAMGHLPGDPLGQEMGAATQVAFADAMRQAIAAATVIAIVTAGVVSIVVTARITRPIDRLAAAARRIADGHYSERVATDGPGEVGALAATFNEMAGSLEETERRRLQLVGDVAHELRTPLATLDGYLEGLEDGVVSPSAQTWHLLRAETGRLARMVDELSELWRAEARQLPLTVERVDVSRIARDVAKGFEPAAQARAVAIVTAGGEAHASADADRVAQIVANFVSNALRHAPDGTQVDISTSRTASTVRLAVRDRGPGLAPDQLEAVFERFYRVDAARSRAAGGAGIGLAIVRALAEAMDGSAWAESDGPGRGATFWVELPAA